MTTVYLSQDRTSPPRVRRQNPRAQRPAPLTRKSIHTSPKSGAGKQRKSPERAPDKGEGDDDMATSFLQFCATCEKQIIVPNNAILYCSESCRRKDAAKPPFYSVPSGIPSPPTSPFYPGADDPVDGAAPRYIVAPRLPTGRTSSSSRIPALLHDAKSDLDPTEWKPKAERGFEALQYLSQFHRSDLTNQRPGLAPRTTTGITTPALSFTPTTAASSMSVDAPHSFSTLPLRPRYARSSTSAKSIDLVTPQPVFVYHASTAAAAAAAADQAALTYEKRWSLSTASGAGTGSLKQLLYFEHMQGRRE